MPQTPVRTQVRPNLETLEDRCMPAPVAMGGPITLNGANSTWNYSDGGEFNAAPVFADVDGDGTQEALVVQGNKQLYAYKYNTATGGIAVSKVYATGQTTEFHSTPIVVDLPGLGRAIFLAGMNGTVYGWNAASGQSLPGWPSSIDVPDNFYPLGNQPNRVFGALTSGDLDGDGTPEIIVTSYNQHVTALRANGQVMWRYANDDSIESGAVVGDLDRDGKMEVVFGGDSSNNAFYEPGGHVTALSWNGRRRWSTQTPQIIMSSPVLADINNDGTLEVFVGTGVNYPAFDNKIYGLDNLGNTLPGWPYSTGASTSDHRVYTGPAVGDLDGDGILDIVVGDRSGQLHAVKANGQALWVVQAYGQPIGTTPLIADIDNDGDADVIQVGGSQLKAFAGLDGRETWSVTDNGNVLQYLASPAIGRFKGDGNWQFAAMANGSSANGQPRSPSYVRFYELGSTTLAPAWTHQRQDAAGNALARPTGWVNNYISELAKAQVLGRSGQGITDLVNAWLPAFRDANGLEAATAAIVGSTEARSLRINNWYTLYLERGSDQNGVNSFLSFLAQGRSYAEAQASFVGSQEAFNLAGGTNALYVDYMYRKILGRSPQGGEQNNWVNALNANQINRANLAYGFLLSQEYSEKVIRDWYTTLVLGPSVTPSASTLASAGWDLRRGQSAETVLIRLLGQSGRNPGGSDYASTQFESSWLRSMYVDVLQRGISDSELTGWLRNMEGGMTLDTVANAIVRSGEHHRLVVRGWYGAYLGRGNPSDGEIAGLIGRLNNGERRETVVQAIFSSAEYFNRAGGTQAGFVITVFRDLLGHDPDATQTSLWNSRADYRTALPASLMASDEFYFNTIKAAWFMPYLRRYPNTAGNQSALFNAPSGDPYAPVRSFINHLVAGGHQATIQLNILLSGEYFALAHGKAFWGGKRWLM